jgi:hypothetical protein
VVTHRAHCITARTTTQRDCFRTPHYNFESAIAVDAPVCPRDPDSRSRGLHRSGRTEFGTALRWREPYAGVGVGDSENRESLPTPARMASRSLAIPQRTQVNYPTQIVKTSLGMRRYSTDRPSANELEGQSWIRLALRRKTTRQMPLDSMTACSHRKQILNSSETRKSEAYQDSS